MFLYLHSVADILVRDGDPESIIPALVSKFVISEYDAEVLKVENNTHRKMCILVNIVKKKSSDCFGKFCDALRETFHGHLADKLLECEKNYKDEDYPSEGEVLTYCVYQINVFLNIQVFIS